MIKKSLEFLIQSHLFLSFSAFVFSQGILKNQSISLYFSLALAFAVFGIYNLNRINKLKKNLLPHETGLFYRRNKNLLQFASIFSILLSISICLYFLKMTFVSISIVSLAGIITASYIFSIKELSVREIPGMKAFWIVLVWTFLAIILPKIIYNSFQWYDLHYFILFFALSIPGDIRDYEKDKPSMKTIPQILGIRKAETLFYSVIVLFLLLNNRNIFEIVLIIFIVLKLFRSRFYFRYELLDGLLFILGINYLFV
jgi:hypothetical protein